MNKVPIHKRQLRRTPLNDSLYLKIGQKNTQLEAPHFLAYLEEPLQPPDLENAFSDQHAELENTPPLYPSICTLRSIPVGPFPNDNV